MVTVEKSIQVNLLGHLRCFQYNWGQGTVKFVVNRAYILHQYSGENPVKMSDIFPGMYEGISIRLRYQNGRLKSAYPIIH